MKGLTLKEHEELAKLSADYMHLVRVVGVAFDYAYIQLLGGEGSITEWRFQVEGGKLAIEKTKRGAGALHFKPAPLYRFALLRAKEMICAVQNTAHKRNEMRAQNPSYGMRKERVERQLRSQQKLLPLELHTQSKPRKKRTAR